jgi:hypothetical protein
MIRWKHAQRGRVDHRAPVPEARVASKTLTCGDLVQLIDDGKLSVKRHGI